MADLNDLLDDLAAEHAALDERVAALPAADWSRPTPATGWAVRDQICHLWYFDRSARLALVEPEAFAAHAGELTAGMAAATADGTPSALADTPDVVHGRRVEPAQLLEDWRSGRAALLEAARSAGAVDPAARVPWYGLAMGIASFVTARLMETWAHGQDVADALGLAPVASERLRHVCHIGIGARPYAFRVNGRADPGDPVSIEVVSPAGQTWSWGPPDAADRIRGAALDLALVVTQRRHPADTALVVTGPTASAWIGIAQSFAGPAGPGRPPAGVASAGA